MKKDNIFEFSDYRTFLKNHFQEGQKRNPYWSYQAWSKTLGLKNNTSLLKIVHGQRGIGPQIKKKLIEYFKFNPSESEYFETLIALSRQWQKNTPDEKYHVMVKKLLNSPAPSELNVLLDGEFSRISKWWFYGIRQLTRLKSFSLDPRHIQKHFRFKLKLKEIRDALEILKQQKLLVWDAQKKQYVIGQSGLVTKNDYSNEALRQYHEEILRMAGESIRKVAFEERQISGVTFSIRQADLEDAKKTLFEFQKNFCDQFEAKSSNGDHVYHLELAFFPLTKKGNLF